MDDEKMDDGVVDEDNVDYMDKLVSESFMKRMTTKNKKNIIKRALLLFFLYDWWFICIHYQVTLFLFIACFISL